MKSSDIVRHTWRFCCLAVLFVKEKTKQTAHKDAYSNTQQCGSDYKLAEAAD